MATGKKQLTDDFSENEFLHKLAMHRLRSPAADLSVSSMDGIVAACRGYMQMLPHKDSLRTLDSKHLAALDSRVTPLEKCKILGKKLTPKACLSQRCPPSFVEVTSNYGFTKDTKTNAQLDMAA